MVFMFCIDYTIKSLAREKIYIEIFSINLKDASWFSAQKHRKSTISSLKVHLLSILCAVYFSLVSLLEEFNKVGNASDYMFTDRDVTTTSW